MTLDEQYQKIIDDQRTYLLKLQADFNTQCEEAKKKAQEKLKNIPGEQKEAREKVLQEQKGELEGSLHILKNSVSHSTRETMKKLEAIVQQKEANVLADLEKQMAAL